MNSSLPSGAAPHAPTRDWIDRGTPIGDEAVHVRDLRGWFYRLFTDDPRRPVLQIGEGFAQNWFADVVETASLADAGARGETRPFDLVILHYSLGGCDSLAAAIAAAARLLARGGRLVIAGENRLRPHLPTRGGPRAPSATLWGYRSALREGGFDPLGEYVAHPPGSQAVYLVATDPQSATPFFRNSVDTRALPRWSPKRLAMRMLIETHLMQHVQPGFVVAGSKC